ncbi:hypothetical protein BD410DRAFT_840679 [Rickenella mellea]|uniref:Uncharacterized protein n=1 Tax=Rickenella mellea TaxID=50990 RepID=A0A4Y7Q348_9AGAM|nr:hypothetical protein BD410DRAFT_840679 [Rickenella mellea]
MEGLDDLLNLLTRVKKNGWDNTFPDSLYDNDSKEATRLPISSGNLSTFLDAIEEARKCISALNEAQRQVGKRLRCLRRLSKPLVLEDGIKRLPDDVLAIVFELACPLIEDDPSQSAVPLSHVSRRFRSVALSCPSLWTSIYDRYGDNMIREFISRSGRLDLDVNIHSSSRMESFLKLMKDTAHRWSSLDPINCDLESLMKDLGITDLPRLRHLTYISPVELSTDTFSLPNLSQIVAMGWPPAGSYLLSNLTHVEFHILSDDMFVEDLVTTLYSMKKLKDLSFKLHRCPEENFLLSDNVTHPKAHSVHIERLAISIDGDMQGYSALFFDALMYLWPSTVELSIDSIGPEKFLVDAGGESFLFGSAIKLQIPRAFDVMTTLMNILRNCDIVETVHFDTPLAKGPTAWRRRQLRHDDWERIGSLDNLRFMNCDGFTESDITTLARNTLLPEAEQGLQSLEIISCKLISEDFLLGLHDDVGDRLKWTL